MSGKASYAIFLSFMALFAALAANAGEPAAAERAAVLRSVGNQAAYAKALERYSERLSHAFAPVSAKGKALKAEPIGTKFQDPTSAVNRGIATGPIGSPINREPPSVQEPDEMDSSRTSSTAAASASAM